jgi:hypothetical protein
MKYSTITTTWKRFSLLSIATLFLTGTGFSQFSGLESEIHATSEFGTTYRIYAHFDSPADEVFSVYSVGQVENGSVNLDLETTTTFYHEPIAVSTWLHSFKASYWECFLHLPMIVG